MLLAGTRVAAAVGAVLGLLAGRAGRGAGPVVRRGVRAGRGGARGGRPEHALFDRSGDRPVDRNRQRHRLRQGGRDGLRPDQRPAVRHRRPSRDARHAAAHHDRPDDRRRHGGRRAHRHDHGPERLSRPVVRQRRHALSVPGHRRAAVHGEHEHRRRQRIAERARSRGRRQRDRVRPRGHAVLGGRKQRDPGSDYWARDPGHGLHRLGGLRPPPARRRRLRLVWRGVRRAQVRRAGRGRAAGAGRFRLRCDYRGRPVHRRHHHGADHRHGRARVPAARPSAPTEPRPAAGRGAQGSSPCRLAGYQPWRSRSARA